VRNTLKTPPATKSYRDGWDRIWGKKNCALCEVKTKFLFKCPKCSREVCVTCVSYNKDHRCVKCDLASLLGMQK
jgi:hypothetical protein